MNFVSYVILKPRVNCSYGRRIGFICRCSTQGKIRNFGKDVPFVSTLGRI